MLQEALGRGSRIQHGLEQPRENMEIMQTGKKVRIREENQPCID